MGAMASTSPPRWTEEELQAWLNRRGTPSPTQTPPSPPRKPRAKKMLAVPGQESPPEPKKRRGVEVKPVIDAINSAHIRITLDPQAGVLSILFEGVKLLSLNELFSIQQFRKYEAFRYKKAWRRAIDRALGQLGPQAWRSVFPGPVKMTLFRRSAKSYDLDSPITPFKYAVDSLVRHEYWLGGVKMRGVIVDDRREYVPEMKEAHAIGPPCVGLRLERCEMPPPAPELHPESEWFGQPPIEKTT